MICSVQSSHSEFHPDEKAHEAPCLQPSLLSYSKVTEPGGPLCVRSCKYKELTFLSLAHYKSRSSFFDQYCMSNNCWILNENSENIPQITASLSRDENMYIYGVCIPSSIRRNATLFMARAAVWGNLWKYALRGINGLMIRSWSGTQRVSSDYDVCVQM